MADTSGVRARLGRAARRAGDLVPGRHARSASTTEVEALPSESPSKAVPKTVAKDTAAAPGATSATGRTTTAGRTTSGRAPRATSAARSAASEPPGEPSTGSERSGRSPAKNATGAAATAAGGRARKASTAGKAGTAGSTRAGGRSAAAKGTAGTKRATKTATAPARPAKAAAKAEPAKSTGRGAARSGRPVGAAAGRSGAAGSADTLPVPPGTDWTQAELAEVRSDLSAQLGELRAEYNHAIAELNLLQQSANDGAGDDQADAGTKTFEREQELSIANNRLDLLTQMERAIERLDAGTYGRCESCGNSIPKARLQAFPSATLCVTCKQREERR